MTSISTYASVDAEHIAKDLHSSVIAGLSKHGIKHAKRIVGANLVFHRYIWRLLRIGFSPFSLGTLIVLLYTALFQQDPTASLVILALFIALQLSNAFSEHLTIWHHVKKLCFFIRMDFKRHTVIRSRAVIKAFARELVPGDIIMLDKGMFIPADLKLIESEQLHMDESDLFGHTHSARLKLSRNDHIEDDIRSFRSIIFAGSTVFAGSGKAMVVQTGAHRVAHKLFSGTFNATQYAHQLVQLGKVHVIAALALLVAIHMSFLSEQTVAFALAFTLLTPVFAHLAAGFFALKERVGVPYENSKRLIIPLETILKPEVLESRIFVNRQTIDIVEAESISTHKKLIPNFLQIFHMGIPENKHLSIYQQWQQLRTYMDEQHGFIISHPEGLTPIPNQSIFEVDESGHSLNSMFVYEHELKDNRTMLLRTKISSPEDLIEEATYIWDDNMSGSRRRFYVEEKKKLFEQLEHLRKEGHIIHGVAFEEEELTDKGPLNRTVFIGYLAVPCVIPHEYFALLERARSAYKHIVLYTFGEWNRAHLGSVFDADEVSACNPQLIDDGGSVMPQLESRFVIMQHATFPALWSLAMEDEHFPNMQMGMVFGHPDFAFQLPPSTISQFLPSFRAHRLVGLSSEFVHRLRTAVKATTAAQVAAAFAGYLFMLHSNNISFALLALAPGLMTVCYSAILRLTSHLTPSPEQFKHPANNENYFGPRFFYDITMLSKTVVVLFSTLLVGYLYATAIAHVLLLPLAEVLKSHSLYIFCTALLTPLAFLPHYFRKRDEVKDLAINYGLMGIFGFLLVLVPMFIQADGEIQLMHLAFGIALLGISTFFGLFNISTLAELAPKRIAKPVDSSSEEQPS